ncbi:YgaP-like transmembrane domain [Pedobacter sp. SYSU D00535]|uniref:YgaP-like transmembrane domain n=1 Tax=Pedobacter sp. SYSU D00535 TaxID=2810308 RepID=UPI001A96FE6A|nr:YgaP-like transmembrane domain [Pedobacter sp. SYSU D00535]
MIDQLTNTVNDRLKGTAIEPPGYENVNTTERVISAAAGTYILFKGLTTMFKHPFIGLGEAALGGMLLYRGATGYCPIYEKIGKDTTDLQAIRITERFIVNKPREEVYRFWRHLENLPKFMKHLASVTEIDEKVSHWAANIPGNVAKINWNAEITREEENRYIGWQSVDGSMVDNAGKVEFTDAISGAGTELNIELNYFPPAGSLGHGIAQLFNGWFEKMVREDIMNFKHYVEGEEYQRYMSTAAGE